MDRLQVSPTSQLTLQRSHTSVLFLCFPELHFKFWCYSRKMPPNIPTWNICSGNHGSNWSGLNPIWSPEGFVLVPEVIQLNEFVRGDCPVCMQGVGLRYAGDRSLHLTLTSRARTPHIWFFCLIPGELNMCAAEHNVYPHHCTIPAHNQVSTL